MTNSERFDQLVYRISHKMDCHAKPHCGGCLYFYTGRCGQDDVNALIAMLRHPDFDKVGFGRQEATV